MSLPSTELYREIKYLARNMMRGERKGHTLSATDLFHEAYSRLRLYLSNSPIDSVACRSLFALTMRRVLVEHARKRIRRANRFPRMHIPQSDFDKISDRSVEKSREKNAENLLALETALNRLACQFPIHAKIVELKYFGGLTVNQCSEQLGIGSATVQRYWNFARAWIGREMENIDYPLGNP